MSFHSDTHSYASSNASSDTAPSSVASHLDDAEHYSNLQRQTDELVKGLLKEKRESGTILRAWAERCATLEAEVGRLAKLVQSLEFEKVAVAAEANAPQATTPPPTRAEASSCAEAVPCKWTGKAWAPVSSNSANTSLRIPQIDPTKSMSKQDPPPCNSFYLAGGCSVPRCKYAHLYELTPTQLDEMKRGAKFHICNALLNGLECEDTACVYGHVCPRGSACGRTNCAFNDAQHRGPPSTNARPAPRRR